MKYLLLLVSLSLSTASLAHEPERKKPLLDWSPPVSAFDPATPAQADSIRLDLRVEGNTLQLFVTDRYGEPVDIGVAEAKALVSTAGKMTWFQLQPSGTHMLSGSGEFAHDPATRVDITLRLPGRKPLNRVFRPFQ